MARILIVEDDLKLIAKLRDWLEGESYHVEECHSGEDALQILSNYSFDLILLDCGLEKMDGLEVCSRYRRSGGATPVLFLTGRGEITDKVQGLNAGGDDYLVKPFDVRELTARISSLLRRASGQLGNKLTIKDVCLNADTRTVLVGDESVHLSIRECAVLEYLMRHPDRFFNSKQLLASVWPLDKDGSEETVRSCLRLLRRKLEKVGRGDFVKTELGSGYIIDAK